MQQYGALLIVAVSSLPLVSGSVAVAEGAPVEGVRTIEPIANPEVRFTAVAPPGDGPLLRLSLLLSEVYCSVVVEEIYEDPLKEGAPSVEVAHVLTSHTLAAPLGISKLTQLRFVRWRSPTEAELANGELHFLLTRTGRGQFQVRPANQ